MDVPSPAAGTLAAHLAAEGDEVAIGAIIARIEAGDGVAAPAAPAHEAAATATTVRTGPAARQAASRDHVDLKDVTGTGRRGRVTTEDVSRARAPAPVAAAPLPAPAPAPVAPPSGGKVQRVRMTPLRRTIARRLVQAQQTAAILTTFNEIDMSAVMALRARHQDRFVARHGIKLGFMSFFVKASIEALKEFPARRPAVWWCRWCRTRISARSPTSRRRSPSSASAPATVHCSRLILKGAPSRSRTEACSGR
jgi:2-oxoglutarate dehydrogenase E2 component (dihydrolipoamide succinyltransferase)